jgi:hypothetical protein
MSKRWIYTSGLFSLLTLSLHSWGSWREHAYGPTTRLPLATDKFPLTNSQGWFTEESYLILKPHEDNLWYTSKLALKGTAGDHYAFHIKKETPDFGWYSGVRLNIGRYLPHHDHWDITLSTTYYYASTEDHSHADRAKGSRLTSRWANLSSAPLYKADVSWRLNYFTWDLSIGRLYQMTPWFYTHPFIGLRAAYITQDYSSKGSSDFILTSGTASQRIAITQKFKADNDLWGIGPHIGTHFQFNFRHHWSLLGSFAGSLLLGSYDVQENIRGTLFRDNIVLAESDRASEDAFSIRANLEGTIGLGWEKWVKKHTVRIAPSFLFEATEWFDINHFFEITRTPKPGDISLVKKTPSSGSLGLMGFSINLQVDF